MPAKGFSPPDLTEIELASAEYKRLADSVTGRLDAFIKWFNALPGKTGVFVRRDEIDRGRWGLLNLDRTKEGGWTLLFGIADKGQGIKSLPIEQASLSDKCVAITMLPELLHELHAKQLSLVDRLKEASEVLAQLPAPKGGK